MRASALDRSAAGVMDRLLPVGAVAAAGCGAFLAGAGWVAGDPRLAWSGGLLLTFGFGVVLVGGWVSGLPLLAAILLLPAPYETESLRLSAAAAGTAFVVGTWVLRRAVDREPIRRGALPTRSGVALLAAVAISAALARAPMLGARELVTFLLLGGLLLAATDELAGSGAAALGARLARVIAAVAAVAGPLAALEALGVLPGRFPLPGTGLHRATLGLGWPNELGMFFATSIPLAVFVLRAAANPAARVLAAIGLAGVTIGLVATFSRGAWLAVPVGAAVLFLSGDGRLVLRIWGAALVGGLVMDALSGGAVTARITSLGSDWVVEQRAALLVAGLVMFRAHPLVGVGPGGYGSQLERFGMEVSWLWDYVGSAHNTFVHLAAETGVLGLGAFVAFTGASLLVLIRGARRARMDPHVGREERMLRPALLWAFGTVLVLGMFEWIFAHGVAQLIVLVAAMGFALGGSGRHGRKEGA